MEVSMYIKESLRTDRTLLNILFHRPIIFSTVITLALIQVPWESHVMFTDFFGREQAKIYWKFHIRFALLAFAICFLTWCGTTIIPFSGISGLLLKACAAAGLATGLLTVLFRKELLGVLDVVLHKH